MFRPEQIKEFKKQVFKSWGSGFDNLSDHQKKSEMMRKVCEVIKMQDTDEKSEETKRVVETIQKLISEMENV